MPPSYPNNAAIEDAHPGENESQDEKFRKKDEDIPCCIFLLFYKHATMQSDLCMCLKLQRRTIILKIPEENERIGLLLCIRSKTFKSMQNKNNRGYLK